MSSYHALSNHRSCHRHALLPLCVSLATIAPLASVHAQPTAEPAASAQLAITPQQAMTKFDLPAGKLSTALNALARQSGLTLSVEPALLAHKTVVATKGRFTAQQALDRLLAATDLTAQVSGSAIVIIRKPMAASTLQTVKINAAALGATTEGTGSYTTRAASNATGLSLSLRETPQSVTVVTRDRMQDQGMTSIADVMTQIVGISSRSGGALGTDNTNYVARGFAVQNYMVDGVPRPEGIYGFREETADMTPYDRIEVIRGAAGLMAGTGVPSASINMIRKRPTAEFAGAVTAKTGTWDLYRLEADVGGTLAEGVRGRVAAAYQENDTFVDREHAERKVFYGVIETDIAESTLLTAGIEYQDYENLHASRGGVPLLFSDGTETDFSRATNNAADWSSFERDSTNVFVSLDHSFNDDWRANVAAERKQGSYDDHIGYIWSTTLNPDGSGGNMMSARWAADLEIDAIDAGVQGAFDWLGRKHDVSVTASYASYKDDGTDLPGWWNRGVYYTPMPNAFDFYATGDWPQPDLDTKGDPIDSEITQSAITALTRLKPTDSLSIILGSRVTNWEEDNIGDDNDSEENSVITPYAGVVYDLTSALSLYVSYTNVFEPQSEVDIEGDRLDPLEGNNYELGLKAELLDGRLNASAAVFQMQQDNFPVPLGENALGDPITAPDGSTAHRAESGTEVKGFELEAGGELTPGWQVAGGYARADAEDRDGKTLESNVPRNTFKLFTSYKLRGDLSGLTLGGNLRWQNRIWEEGSLPDDTPYKYEQGSFSVIDLTAKYVLPQDITLALHANNVFDKRYYSGLVDGGSRYGEPRNYNLSVRYDF